MQPFTLLECQKYKSFAMKVYPIALEFYPFN